MSKITGRAKKFDGTPIDYVSIFNWVDGTCIAQVVPDASGAWEFYFIDDLDVGFTYIADGCEPITHGRYILRDGKAKWWRVNNIKIRNSSNPSYRNGNAAELRFNTVSGIISDNPARGISANTPAETDAYVAGKAFDSNPSTFAYSEYYVVGFGVDTWWIGYEFDEPQKVTSISVQMRQGLKSDWGLEWQTADIEFSDDGVKWFRYGRIEPRIAATSSSLVTKPIILD